MRKFSLVALILITFFSVPACVFAAGAPAEVLDARQGVAKIYCEDYDYGVVAGSGFAIGDGGSVDFIVTNYHVVEGEPDVITVVTDTNLQTKARIYAELPASDLVILQLNKPIYDLTPLRVNVGDMERNIGQEVYALGFPGAADMMFDEADYFQEQVSVTSGIISAVKPISFFSDSGKTVRTYQIDVPLSGGNSGGPLLNGQGEVIGINSFGLSGEGKVYADAENINGAISTLELKQLLDEHGIEYMQGRSFPYGALVAIAVAAAGTVLWLAVRKRKGMKMMKNRMQSGVMTLRQYLETVHVVIPFDEALRLLSPVAYQLRQMHAQMKIYDNISPDTLSVSPVSGQAELMDISGAGMGAGNVLISPGFSPMEKYRQDMPETAATDVFGFCATLYYILFRANPPEIFERVRNDETVTRNVGALPILGVFKQALLRGLNPEPRARFQNAGEMIGALSISPPVQPVMGQDMQRNAAVVAPGRKKRPLWLIPVGAIAAAAVILGALVANGNSTLKAAELLVDQERYAQAVQKFDSVYLLPASYQGEYALAQAGAAMQDENYEEALTCLDEMEETGRTAEMRKDVILAYSEQLYFEDKAEESLALLEPYRDDEEIQQTIAWIMVAEVDWLFQNDDFEGGYEWMARVPDTDTAQRDLKTLVEEWVYILAYEYYDLDEAIALLNHVPDQEAEYVKELKEELVAEKVMALIDEGEYEEALELLELMGGSAEYADVTRFLQATDMIDDGDLGEARDLLESLRSGDFSGPARELLATINSEEYLNPLLIGSWENAIYYLDVEEEAYGTNLPVAERAATLYLNDGNLLFADELDNVLVEYEVWHLSSYNLVIKNEPGNSYEFEAVF